MARLSAAPADGFPRSLKTEAEVEGFYRLLSNPRVNYGSLVQAHVEQTVQRMEQDATVLVAHDTTEFQFSGEPGSRQGLGQARGDNSSHGFFAHVSLGLTASSAPQPLGALGMHCWARTQRRKSAGRHLTGAQLARLSHKESDRWAQQINAAEEAVGGRCSLIHVMDREADTYALLHDMADKGRRFVVRMARDRVVHDVGLDGDVDDDDPVRLSEALTRLRVQTKREVALSSRAPSRIPGKRRTHAPRVSRSATLAVSAGRVALRRPNYFGQELPDILEVNVVYAREVDTPEGCTPVAWVLVTSEPIETNVDIEAVLDHYRARWTIEEFFKALKTGCAFESRQLESFKTLTNALALFLPVAWQMLLLRSLTRSRPDEPATAALTAVQLQILRHFQTAKMPVDNATVRDALYAVAGLGGHLKNNGFPGWLTLSRGMQELVLLEAAWIGGVASVAKTASN
jgi:IS4 transposase